MMSIKQMPRLAIAAVALAPITACGGGGASFLSRPPLPGSTSSPTTSPSGAPTTSPSGAPTTSPTGSPTTSPTAMPSPSAVVVTPNTLSFTSVGNAQMANVSEAAYTGTFAQSNTCAGIATVSGGTADAHGGYDFSVTAQNGGQCTVTFMGDRGTQGTLALAVTTSSVIITGHARS